MDATIVDCFQKRVLQHPELFFTPSEEVASDIKTFTKSVFDNCTKFVSKKVVTPLDQLYIDGFDADQIWEQLQLQNEPLVAELALRIRTFAKHPEQIRLFPMQREETDNEEEEEEPVNVNDVSEEEEADENDDNESNDDNVSIDDEEEPIEESTSKKSTKKSKNKARDVAEDGFFNWDDMEKMAEEEELDEDEDDEGEDELDDIEGDDDEDDSEEDGMGDDEAANMKYNDFFDEEDPTRDDEGEESDEDEMDEGDAEEFLNMHKSQSAQDDNVEDEDDDEAAERGVMSSHQRRKQLLQQEIKQYEKEAIGDKPWELTGEVRSQARPENSLLEAVLDYDRPVKVAPVITVEVSMALEELIKKRILDDDFDDVIRKFAGNEQDEKQKLLEVSMEKSKEGLGELYEKEYMKTAMGFEQDDASKQDQDEIEVMFKSLCWKLDALSNYQFTPKPMVKELQVKPSVPAIAMEEVVPISVSDANLKAPEEIFEKKRKRGEGVLQSTEEMSQNERQAQRNAKKRARRKEKKQKEADERLVAKINPGLGNKYEKKKMLESIAHAKNITSGQAIEGSTKQFSNSKEFFSRLQEQVRDTIRKKTDSSD